MDARETKMANLIKQRNYIQKQLDQVSESNSGDAGYDYEGDLFPENREYFRDANWQVSCIGRNANGKVIYHFSCADTVLSFEDQVKIGLKEPFISSGSPNCT